MLIITLYEVQLRYNDGFRKECQAMIGFSFKTWYNHPMKITKKLFYFLSFTWGALETLSGLLVGLIMLLTGHKPHKWGWCWYFELGKKDWGGAEWGLVFLKDKSNSTYLKNHEFGHALQNCILGPFMILLVNLPSTIRYWARRIGEKFGYKPKNDYDDIWFEGSATRMGTKKIKEISAEK